MKVKKGRQGREGDGRERKGRGRKIGRKERREGRNKNEDIQIYFSVTQYFFSKKILFTFRERGREGQRGKEKHLLVASWKHPSICPHWELNW